MIATRCDLRIFERPVNADVDLINSASTSLFQFLEMSMNLHFHALQRNAARGRKATMQVAF